MTLTQIVVLSVVGLFLAALLGFLAWVPWHYHPSEILHTECLKCSYLRWRAKAKPQNS